MIKLQIHQTNDTCSNCVYGKIKQLPDGYLVCQDCGHKVENKIAYILIGNQNEYQSSSQRV